MMAVNYHGAEWHLPSKLHVNWWRVGRVNHDRGSRHGNGRPKAAYICDFMEVWAGPCHGGGEVVILIRMAADQTVVMVVRRLCTPEAQSPPHPLPRIRMAAEQAVVLAVWRLCTPAIGFGFY